MSAADWIRPDVQALSAYAVPEMREPIKLDAMENPWPWPDENLRAAWLERMATVTANRYPDPRAPALVERLRAHLGLAPEQALLLGNGSDELIQLITLALARPGATVLAPEPTFVMYRMIATFCGLRHVGVPLGAGFGLDVEATRRALAEHEPAITYLAWPNNPTGNLWPRADIEAVIEAAPGLVVIDEAYQPFAGDSFIGDLGRWPHVVVLRTLSKLGLAGLRLGALAGPEAWLNEIDKLRLPYNINVLTQASAEFALEHFPVLERQAAAIRSERDRMARDLAASGHLEVHPSAANFLLVRFPCGQARAAFEALLAAGIRVKCLDGSHPALADCLRLTIGTADENAALERALREWLATV
jgi:histidinol-phosphate aminotransferase